MTMGFTDLAGYKVFSFDKIPSTQDMAHDLIAASKATNKTAVVALAQSAGRGRHRRRWVSHHGNLYVSFIYDSDIRDGRLSYSVAFVNFSSADSLILLAWSAIRSKSLMQ